MTSVFARFTPFTYGDKESSFLTWKWVASL